MVSTQSVEEQLKRLKFNQHAWGRSEVSELPNIIMPGEVIFECVNGMYEGGFALLVATDARVLLIDKKPLNYLTVEDLRFDMINELDYSHRMIGAQISISAGSKNLKFKSYNQPRLRKLISHVQHCMAEYKKIQTNGQQDQKQHLEQINQQLQAYLIAQHQQQEALREQLKGNANGTTPEPAKPDPALSDFLFAQSLLKQYRDQERGQAAPPVESRFIESTVSQPEFISAAPPQLQELLKTDASPQLADLYAEGMKEIFGRQQQQRAEKAATEQPTPTPTPAPATVETPHLVHHPLEINALSIAYSKLPMALRNRKFGRPSFHAHSQAAAIQQVTQYPAT